MREFGIDRESTTLRVMTADFCKNISTSHMSSTKTLAKKSTYKLYKQSLFLKLLDIQSITLSYIASFPNHFCVFFACFLPPVDPGSDAAKACSETPSDRREEDSERSAKRGREKTRITRRFANFILVLLMVQKSQGQPPEMDVSQARRK